MGAALKLECFDRFEPPLQVTHTAEDVQDAYARGVIAGRELGRTEHGAELSEALAALAAQVDALGSKLADRSAASAMLLHPLVAALVDGVLPPLARARLESALLTTFLKLAENVSPLSVSVRCGPDLAPFVSACAAQAGISSFALSADGAEGTVTAELLGGVIAWSQVQVAEQLSRLVQEAMEDN